MLLHKRGSKFRACTHSRNQLDTEPALVAPVVGKGELNQLAALVIADGLEIVNRAAPLQAQNRGVLRVGGPGLADTGDVGDPGVVPLDST